jgi:uncharacterized phage protein (TIGR02216 family)
MSGGFSAVAQRLSELVPRALGWRPHEFWEATPAELAAVLLEDTAAPMPLDRAELAALMEREGDG